MKTHHILTRTIAAFLLAPTIHAVDFFWADPNGGLYADLFNWSLTDGGGGGAGNPLAADVANFTLNNTFTARFGPAVTTNLALDVENGNVTFNLLGNTLLLTTTGALNIGNVFNQTGRLTVRSGILAVDTTGDDVKLGLLSGSTGVLTIATNGRLGDGTILPDLLVGSVGTGTLSVTDNGRVDARNLTVGDDGGAIGTVLINGAAAVVNLSSSAEIGQESTGSLSIQNGGTLSVASVTTVGGFAGSEGTVTVTGTGSQLLSSGTQTIGDSGTGTLNVSSGGRVETNSSAIVGWVAGSDGRATVSGAGSIWTVASTVVIGNSGAGTLTVSGSGEFRGSSTTLGGNATGVGALTVTGAGSVATIAGNLLVGSVGSGTLTVESGAEVITSNLTVSDAAGLPIGTLNLDGGSLFVGGTFTGNGALNFRNGLLRLAGDFQASPSATPFVLNGATNTDLPVLELVGSGAATTNITTLSVGTNRRAQLLLREGRALNLGANGVNIGSIAGGTGIVNVESGASLTNTGTLAVGGNGATAGGTGVLTIDGGTVDIGALRLHSGGTIHLESGVFAADSLPTLNGIFNWTAGEVRLDAASTSLGNFLATKLLGPSKTLHAGQTLSTFVSGGFAVDLATTMTVDGGFVNVENLSNSGTLDLRNGIVNGAATLANTGTVQLGGPLAQLGATTTFTNSGTIRGTGQIVGALTNAVAGRIEVIAGERLLIDTFTNPTNSGTISVIGGELQLNDTLTNSASTGLVSARDAILRTSGVTNNGSFAFSNGTVDVYGDITQNVGGRITISNGGIANFYDDVVIQPGAASVQATALGAIVSRAVFFGSYNGGLTGGGTAFIEGDHRPGNSPALVTFGGDVVYGSNNTVFMELGGTVRGTQYDAINVAGKLTFDGGLTVPLISGFQPTFGNVFNLFDFGSRTGTFTTVNLPVLIPGLAWSQANLYTAGEIQVVLDLALASRTWDGGGVNNAWSTDNNWLTDVEPLNNGAASLIFAGIVRLVPNVDTPWNVAAITFDNTAGAFTINGPQGITIGAGGITNNDTQTQTIDAAITLSANQSFNAAAGHLDIASIALAGQTLTFTGINDVTLATASGSGTVNKSNTGDLDITGALGTGDVTLNANAGDTNIGANETLAALSIADGATVTVGAIPPPAAAFAPVPEPGSGLLAALGAIVAARRANFRRGAARKNVPLF